MRRPAHPVPDAAALPGSAADRFRQTMLPHLDAAYRFARYLARDPAAADDIVQDGYLRAYRAFGTYRGEADRAWLFAILRNCWRDWMRSQHPAGEPVEEEGVEEATPETILLRHGAIASVRQAIEALPAPFREIIVLRELEDMSYREIAVLTDVPIGTVMSRLSRGRQLLAALLGAAEKTGGPCP